MIESGVFNRLNLAQYICIKEEIPSVSETGDIPIVNRRKDTTENFTFPGATYACGNEVIHMLISDMLWAGFFPAWIGYVSRSKINAYGWTDCKLAYFCW